MAENQRVYTRRKIKVIKNLEGVFKKYQPEVGGIYEGEVVKSPGNRIGWRNSEFCVINILDKKIVLRKGEYEIMEDINE